MLHSSSFAPPRTHASRKPATAVLASALAVSFWAGHPMTAEAAEVSVERETVVAPPVQSYTPPAASIATAAVSAVREDLVVTWKSPVQWPVAESSPIGDGFGYRGNVCAGCSTNHLGADLFPGYGEPAFAVADGVVRTVANHGSGWGQHVILEHVIDGRAITTVYAHLVPGGVSVVPGQTVEVGQIIAQTGNSGTSTAPHLHFEVLVGGSHVDPLAWLRANILPPPD
ncbi:peptidase M23-like protein [Microcella putealis]|uniref:Peptidase M23-like protein n=1 Tax=Microcella putealis TaxID=337005 RepID=A0A4Q7LW46_9MICO|nr:M23 family metallopeptidase [Microcella putealis]RZS59265.1 peptidase M23-like protein [Microcella putealis]TQM19890.1 peptidase M23-like protein [Microcella putealis]